MKVQPDRELSQERINQIEKFLKKLLLDQKKLRFITKSNISSMLILDEALTHTSAKGAINHERLEFLGDAVLRLAASEFIDHRFPRLRVGDRSELRAHLVSDRWLTSLGQTINIKEVLIIGPQASKDETARATLEAEATEALIGAIYECCKEIEPIQNWLSNYWDETSKNILADPHLQNPKSALQEWSQGRSLERPKYETKELCKQHGDPKRFFCNVNLNNESIGEGWGRSIKEAETNAARIALLKLREEKLLQKQKQEYFKK